VEFKMAYLPNGRWNVAHVLEKRKLLMAINCIAALR